MSVWQTRYRLLGEQLDELAEQLGGDQPHESGAVTEHTVRLLAAAAMLLRQHSVNKRGQCAFCGWTRWRWRFWHRRPQCTVYSILCFAMSQGLDVVWWQLFESVGKERSLVAVQEWIADRAACKPGDDDEDELTIGLERVGE